MFPKVPREENIFKALDDLIHDPSRGQSHQVQVMKSIHALTTLDEVGHNLREFLAKQRGQLAFDMVGL
jgi:hypothetical protein